MRLLLYPLVVFSIASNVFARDFLPPIQIVTLTAADASTQECYFFQTTAGVKYTVQYSNDLTTWTTGDEIYGLGFEYAVAMRQLAAAPPPESNEGSGTEPPLPPAAPSINVSLRLQPSSDVGGGTVVSWPSLDDGSPVIASTTVPLDSAWEEIPLYLQSFGNYHFFVSHPSLSVPPPVQNPVLGEKDSAMFAMLEASLPAMNLEVANSVVRTRNAPTPAPPNPDDRRFYRVYLDPTLDTDQDGSADWAEFEIAARVAAGNSNPGMMSSGVSGNPFNSDTNNDGIPDGNQLDADLDGTPDANDPDASDQTAFIPLGPVPRYAVFPITNAQPPLSAEFPLQINDKGRVLYENGTWVGGVWTPLPAPSNLLSYGQSQTAFAIAMNDHDVILGQGGVIVGNEAFVGFPGQFEEAGVRCFWSSPAAVPAFVISNSNIRDGYASRWDGDVAFHGTRFRSQLSNDNRFTADFSVFTPGNGSEMGTVNSQSAVWTLPASGSNLSTYLPIGPDILFHNEAGMSWGYITLEDAPYREGILLGVPSSPQIPFVPGNVIAMESGTIAIPSSDSSVAPVALIKGKWEPAPLYRYATDMAKDGTAIGSSDIGFYAPIHNGKRWMHRESHSPELPAPWLDTTVELLDITPGGWILAERGNYPEPQKQYAVMLPLRLVGENTRLAANADGSHTVDTEAVGVDNFSISSYSPGETVAEKIWIMAPTNIGKRVICKSPVNSATPLLISGEGLGFPFFPSTTLNTNPAPFDIKANPESVSGSEVILEMKMGPQNASIQSLSKPIGIKIMKDRTVKVTVYKVTKKYGVDSKLEVEPSMMPTQAEITHHLTDLFRPQINTSFQVTLVDLPLEARWDLNNNSAFNCTGLGNPGLEENKIIDEIPSNSGVYNIRVFLVANLGPIGRNADAYGITNRENRTSWVQATPFGKNKTKQFLLDTVGHEIGHIFVGEGHPSDDSSSDRGRAPLPETDHTKRLMCAGAHSNTNSRLLVKGEWDEAENWMKIEEDEGRLSP